MHTSTLIANAPCELINITPYNPLISKCQIKVCYVGDKPNRNGSIITKEVAREMANTLPGSPIVGFYNENTGDFEEHNRRIDISGGTLKFEDTTRPYGFVDLGAKVWFQDYLDEGVVHTYLVTEGWLWTGQYPETKRIIEHGNNHSMELDEETLDGSWTIDDKNGMEFFIINDAIFKKLCILGEDFEPCFEGSSITHFSLDDDFNQKIYALMKEVKKLKGGNSLMDEEKVVEEMTKEEEVVIPEAEEIKEEGVATAVEEPVEAEPEAVEEEEAPAEEKEISKDETVSFSLDEFQTLQGNYSELETKYNDLMTQFNEMKANYDVLVEFKKAKDIEAKQAMIDSFYMLSDEDKKDVQDNVENYSLEDIEAKLSIICVHNKLDLSEKKETEEQVETTFSLAEDNDNDFAAPAWVSLLRKNKEKN